MRIAIVVPALVLGGAEDILVRLAAGLSKMHETKIVLLQRCYEENAKIKNLPSNVEITSIIPGIRSETSFAFRLVNLFLYLFSPLIAPYALYRARLHRCDVIHVNLTQVALYSCFWRALLCCCARSRPIILQTFHTNLHLLKIWQRIIFHMSWRVADKLIIEIDRAEIDRVRNVAPNTSIEFIPFAIGHTDPILFKSFRFDNIITLGSLARLSLHEKKYDKILQGLAILKEDGFKFRYLIGGDGPDREPINALISELKLDDQVEMLGPILDKEMYFSKLDLLIVATVGRETGIAGLQALANGIPIVGFNTFSNATSGDHGALMVANTPQELKEMILTLSVGSLEQYWNSLYKDRYLQLDDQEMISAYNRVMEC